MENTREKSAEKFRKSRLIIGLIVTGLILFGLFVGSGILFQNTFRQNAIALQSNEIQGTSVEIRLFLSETMDAVKLESYELNDMLKNGASNEELLEYLSKHTVLVNQAYSSDYTGLYGLFKGTYLDGGGWVPEDGYVAQERPWYQAALKAQGEMALVTPYIDSQTHRATMSVSRLLYDKKSVLSLDISLDGVQEIISRDFKENRWDGVMLLDETGVVVAHSDPGEVGNSYKESDDTIYGAVLRGIRGAGDRDTASVRFDGRTYDCVFSDVGHGWMLAAYAQEKQLMGTFGKILLVTMLIILIGYVMIIVILVQIYRRRGEMEVVNRQLRAVAGIYASMYLFDLDNDTYAEVAGCAGEVRTLVESISGGAQKTLRMVMDAMTDERFKTSIYAFTNLSTLSDRLKGKKTITREFIDTKNGRCCGRFVPVEWAEDGHLKTVLWMVEFLENRRTGG